MRFKLLTYPAKHLWTIATAVVTVITLIIIIFFQNRVTTLSSRAAGLDTERQSLLIKLKSTDTELKKLKAEDQYVINKKNEEEIKNIQDNYSQTVEAYEKLLDAKSVVKKTDTLDAEFAEVLRLLSEKNYPSASAKLSQLKKDIDTERNKATAAFQIPANATQSNTAPANGYQRQVVKTNFGEFLVDIVAADLNSTRVVVDTAFDGTCTNDCPVLSVGDYAARSGAYAAVNGSYFCPADYPSCADKKNSFDTLLMNKNKVYFNSDNNVYSTVPAVIFAGTSARFVGRSLEWGRDTGVDAVIANQPLLVLNGQVVFGGDDEVKRSGQGSRSFVGASGSTAYIGVVHNVNAAQMARVLQTMGIQNALNLDSGGSTALWAGGYKVGPGRNIPNAILFLHK